MHINISCRKKGKSGAMDELGPGKSIVDRPAEAFAGEFLCDNEIHIRRIGVSQGMKKMAGGFMQVTRGG